MKKLVPILLLTALLASCNKTVDKAPVSESSSAQASSSQFSSVIAFNPTFDLPDGYHYVDGVKQGVTEFGDKQAPYAELKAAKGEGGERPQISVLKTPSSKMVELEKTDYPFVPTMISGVEWQRFRRLGMGDTEGFIRKMDNNYIIVTFDFPPAEAVIMQVMQSLKIN